MNECPECGNKVSSLAENCPDCGADLARRKWFGGGGLIIASLLLLAGALYLVGFYTYPVIEHYLFGPSRPVSETLAENPGEELSITRLDAYEACQTFLEERLSDQVGSGVSTMKPWDERINQVTERNSARTFRVNSRRAYSVVGKQGVRDILYDCEVYYGEDEEWDLRRLTMRQR